MFVCADMIVNACFVSSMHYNLCSMRRSINCVHCRQGTDRPDAYTHYKFYYIKSYRLQIK